MVWLIVCAVALALMLVTDILGIIFEILLTWAVFAIAQLWHAVLIAKSLIMTWF